MGKKILVIDDVQNERTLMRRVIEEEGHCVQEAESGETGVETVQKNKLDIVVIDTKLTGIDGFETCKKIKEIDNKIKCIVLTGDIEVFDEVKAKMAGADAYTVKGTNFSALREELSKMMK